MSVMAACLGNRAPNTVLRFPNRSEKQSSGYRNMILTSVSRQVITSVKELAGTQAQDGLVPERTALVGEEIPRL